jgi:hypothetical protein
MGNKLITWVDNQGRFRITTPMDDSPKGLVRTWEKIVAAKAPPPKDASGNVLLNDNGDELPESSLYNIPLSHPHFIIDNDDLQAVLTFCCVHYFRWGVLKDGPHGNSDARDSAWEMDTDGTPKVNMAKARGIHMDKIRIVRNAELAKKDIEFMKALEADDGSHKAIAVEKQTLRDIPQTFDLTTDTPEELKQKWPENLPKE